MLTEAAGGATGTGVTPHVGSRHPPRHLLSVSKSQIVEKSSGNPRTPDGQNTRHERRRLTGMDPHRLTERSTLDWYLEPWKKYGVFTGRARRKGFLVFALRTLILFLALVFLVSGEILFGDVLGEIIDTVAVLIYLAILVLWLAVVVRRIHDSNHSGWWIIVPFVRWIFFCVDGTRGPNRFGNDPI